MKKLILAATAALMMTAAHADPICATLGELARTVMGSRQLGVPLSQLMEIVKDTKVERRIVLEAYERPRFQSESLRQSSIEDFGNEWETTCYRARSGGKNV